MKWMALGVVAATAMTSPVGAEGVSSAWGDWREIPPVVKKGDLRVSSETVNRIADSLQKDACPVAGDYRHVRLSVPFLMEFAPSGQIQQVVVWKLNCPQIEALVGGTLLQMARSGEYRPTGLNQLGWYRGEFKLMAN